jgi:hypothetical protein
MSSADCFSIPHWDQHLNGADSEIQNEESFILFWVQEKDGS